MPYVEVSELLSRSVKTSFCMIRDTKIKEGVDISLLFKKLELSFEGPVIIRSLWFDGPLFPFPSSRYPTGGKELIRKNNWFPVLD